MIPRCSRAATWAPETVLAPRWPHESPLITDHSKGVDIAHRVGLYRLRDRYVRPRVSEL